MIQPILYKLAKTGKITQWFISTDGPTVITETGYTDGQKTHHTYDALPKNQGKANETTASEQADIEAKAKWDKQLKSKYVEHPSGITQQKLPRRVGVWQDLFKSDKTLEKLNDIVYVENKYDGINGTFRYRAGLELSSRGGESFPLPGHQMHAINDIMLHFNLPALNVEQYIHGMHLQNIQSAVTKSNKNSKDLTAVIFAFPEHPGTYREQLTLRLQILAYITMKGYTHVDVSIPTEVTIPRTSNGRDMSEIDKLHNQAVANGYEGIIVANGNNEYIYNEQSSSIWKYKIQLDGEYKITGHELDKKGNPTLKLMSPGGEFKVRPMGDQASRDAMLSIIDTLPGQWYKIKYEKLSLAGKPTKPVGVALRKCTPEGDPLE